MKKSRLRRYGYIIEAFFGYLLYTFFYLLPIDWASALAGFIGESIGPKLKVSRIAYTNLTRCFPAMPDTEKKRIIKQMWNNLGRIAGELPHWPRMSSREFARRVKFINPYRSSPKEGVIFLGAHLANFELAPMISKELELSLSFIYRPANNPYIDRLINSLREKCRVKLFPKGVTGLREIYRALGHGTKVAFLVDQKVNDGETINFFGLPAKTTTLPAKLALKFGSPIILSRAVRTRGAYYTVEFYDPLPISAYDTPHSITERINSEIEGWIRKKPEQWFWVHKRWGR